MDDKEERAYEYACTWSDCEDDRDDLLECSTKSYIQGATDQDPISRADERKEVIEKACDWIESHSIDYVGNDGITDFRTLYQDFRKAMEE